ncbi:hypothetical protein BEI_2703 [Halomonas beimenensis]|uniref:Uncharacterized protein n=1 Tax=Halomonas beimenensis TaxID=475662 RepID=A0A291P9W8_9GAMM|nr:hypothetical protein BEI_2703 [Halomonas beimenensis]
MLFIDVETTSSARLCPSFNSLPSSITTNQWQTTLSALPHKVQKEDLH